MATGERLEIEGRFDVQVPPGWDHEEDEEGGMLLALPSGPGLLHLVSFEQDESAPLDPAEELYVFLEDQGVELEDDEVEDLYIENGELAYTEYLTEDDDDSGDEDEVSTYWLVGVATSPGLLVFCSYSCPAGSEEAERDAVMGILRSLRMRPEPSGGGER